jgi:iron complex transport system substrate-binding protein
MMPMNRVKRQMLALGLLALVVVMPSHAAVSVQDDDGRTVSLPAPARRIVSLAPHTTELLFAAGAGEHVVATVRYGDYPDAAKALPQVGDATLLDMERIAALKPDLIVVWMHGSAAHQIDRLRALKIPIFHSEPRDLAQIGNSLKRLGVLAGEQPRANAAADAYANELAALRQRYSGRPPLRVFYQVWHQPLLTVNDHHLISDMIHLCGGVNVFGSQPALVPAISVEAVLAARPQVLATSTPDGLNDDSLALWRRFKAMAPLLRQAVIVPADFISRQSPRALIGARQLCEGIEQVRSGPAARQP